MRASESRSNGAAPDYANVIELGPPIAAEVPEDGNEPLPCPACGQSVTMFSLYGHAGCLDRIYWQETQVLWEALNG